MHVAMVSFAVSRPRTISTSFMTFAGLKKCVPITFSGRLLDFANSSILSVEVFEARMQSGRVTRPSSVNVAFLRSKFSNTASVTISTFSKPS